MRTCYFAIFLLFHVAIASIEYVKIEKNNPGLELLPITQSLDKGYWQNVKRKFSPFTLLKEQHSLSDMFDAVHET